VILVDFGRGQRGFFFEPFADLRRATCMAETLKEGCGVFPARLGLPELALESVYRTKNRQRGGKIKLIPGLLRRVAQLVVPRDVGRPDVGVRGADSVGIVGPAPFWSAVTLCSGVRPAAILEHQAGALVKLITGDADYRPFRMRW